MTSPHAHPAPRQVTRPTTHPIIHSSVVGRVTSRGEGNREEYPCRLRRLNEVWVDCGYPRYFLTICTQDRQRVLATDTIHQRLLTFLQGSPQRYGWWPTCYVIMPDHLHLLVYANADSAALGAWVKALKAFVATGEFRWQKSFFDHVIRHDESETEKWEYIRQNLVRAGLVVKAEDWPFAGEIPEYPTPRQVTRPTTIPKHTA
jgi:REP element-mobilizing transposase RayT